VGTARLEGAWKAYEGSRDSGAPELREAEAFARPFTVGPQV
jgi:hypothetical protein